jgi:hypothetical protein
MEAYIPHLQICQNGAFARRRAAGERLRLRRSGGRGTHVEFNALQDARIGVFFKLGLYILKKRF